VPLTKGVPPAHHQQVSHPSSAAHAHAEQCVSAGE